MGFSLCSEFPSLMSVRKHVVTFTTSQLLNTNFLGGLRRLRCFLHILRLYKWNIQWVGLQNRWIWIWQCFITLLYVSPSLNQLIVLTKWKTQNKNAFAEATETFKLAFTSFWVLLSWLTFHGDLQCCTRRATE